MANHLTPTELAREAGLERREVISKCMELGVPDLPGPHRQDAVPGQPGEHHGRAPGPRTADRDVADSPGTRLERRAGGAPSASGAAA